MTTAFQAHGKILVAGQWLDSEKTFTSSPTTGAGHRVCIGQSSHVKAAAEAAEEAFWQFGYTTRSARAHFLNTIADEIERRADDITTIACVETGLPEARIKGERGRTTGQLRMFAQHILQGDYLDRRHDTALPDRQPLPRPDLKMLQRPIGPVAVFGASNFPLAFSTAGGDTAAAFAAGCPVVVKGHEAHPGTSEIIAEAILAALKACDMPLGTFSMIQSGNHEAGASLVQHPLIRAVGFTGSLAGGRALYDLCAQRAEPIPFYGELGSINPMFIYPHALEKRAEEIATQWAGSLTMGAGQFCTNPGVVILQAGTAAERFQKAAVDKLLEVPSQTMLTANIAHAYQAQQQQLAEQSGVQSLLSNTCKTREAVPFLYCTSAQTWLSNATLAEEVFGPLGIIVLAETLEEMQQVAASLQGQLTCTLHIDAEDMDVAARFLPILERKAGRLLVNGFPTGVEVADSMVHGGPYPASTNVSSTSVGSLSIRRFTRPVCYQNMPDALLPADSSDTDK